MHMNMQVRVYMYMCVCGFVKVSITVTVIVVIIVSVVFVVLPRLTAHIAGICRHRCLHRRLGAVVIHAKACLHHDIVSLP